MPRIHSDPSPSGVVLSGTLRAALVEHTKERMRHFFLFLYTYRMLMAVLQCTSGTWAKYVSVKATHQIDVGLRRDEGWDIIFKDADASVLDLPASAFKSVDASHFCNLGLAPSLAGLCAQSTDKRSQFLYDSLVKFCGGTRLMPRRINIGPDRVVDKAHGDLCTKFLKQMTEGSAPISRPFFEAYKEQVVTRMTQYAASQASNGNSAVAEAALIYVATLNESEAPKELRSQGKASRWVEIRPTHSEEVWTTLLGNVDGDFFGYAFQDDANATRSMFVSRSVS